jgi:hypothetical protein
MTAASEFELSEHLITLGGLLEPEHPVPVVEGIAQLANPGRGDRQRPTRRRGRHRSRPRSSSPCPPAIRRSAADFNTASSASSCADPMCSMSRVPCRDEWTICTAVAPDAVFTVRTYRATRAPYDPE